MSEGVVKTYALLYERPDGWWIAGEGWTEREQAWDDAKEQLGPSVNHKVVDVGSAAYRKAEELEARGA